MQPVQPPTVQGNHPAPVYPTAQQTQIIYVQAPVSAPRIYDRYASTTSKVLGIGRIIIGCLAILLQIIAIVIEARGWQMVVSFIGTGIWCGMFFILAGSFGVAAASRKTLCTIVTNMVLAIVSVSIFGLTYLALAATGVGIANDTDFNNNRYGYSQPDRIYGYKSKGGALTVYSLMLILALTQCVFDIMSSVLCCKAVCCGRSSYPGQVILPQTNTQVVYANNPGGVVYQAPQAYHVAPPVQPQAQGVYPYPTAGQPPAYTPTAPGDEKQGPAN